MSSLSSPSSRKLLQSSNPHHFPPVADPPQPLAVDSDVVVILAALLCALICVVGLALVARCAWLRRSPHPSPSPNSNSTPHPPNRGLKKKAIKSLPKFAFHSSSSSSPPDSCSRAVECPICLQEFVEGDEIRILPQCGHAFHVSCVDTWLGSHSSCPFCRQVLVVSSSVSVVAPVRCQKCGAPSSAAVGEGDGNRFLP